MKCKQKSCNRNKNLLSNGFCSVCNEAIMDVNSEQDAKKRVDDALIKDLIGVNERLGRGEEVEQNEAIRLIMGGIITLINKKAGIEEHYEARVIDLEVENNTTKNRLESLESWVLRQDEKLKEMDIKAVENYETIKEMKEQVATLEGIPKDSKETKRREIKCNICEKTFERTCDLEIHMDEHEAEKKYKCSVCGKTFHLKWRKNKHEESHKEEHVKHCRYFSSQETCPYEVIGCKFLHDPSILCKTKNCEELLCPFVHQNVINDEANEDKIEENLEVSDEEQDETLSVNENQCHLCRIQLESKDDVYYYVEINHKEYFSGMMEIMKLGVS